jgi:hypothetical protein
MFAGYVRLGDTFHGAVLFRDRDASPVDVDDVTATRYRVYGPTGLLPLVSGGVVAAKDAGVVTDATPDTPVVLTSVAHGLTDGVLVTVAGVGGVDGAAGTFTVTRLTEDTFALDGSAGSGAYTSGGTWQVTGFYAVELEATAANGFEAGCTYDVLVEGEVAAVVAAERLTFIVV